MDRGISGIASIVGSTPLIMGFSVAGVPHRGQKRVCSSSGLLQFLQFMLHSVIAFWDFCSGVDLKHCFSISTRYIRCKIRVVSYPVLVLSSCMLRFFLNKCAQVIA